MENAIRFNKLGYEDNGAVGTLNAPDRGQPQLGQVEKARARVLVVDDEPDIILSVGKRLAFAGYEVSFAGDGVEATRMALRIRPDVIVLDIGMPCGDGHSVAERIRSNANTMFTPIIYLTARTGEADRERAYSAGAFAYVTKPFKAEELVLLIEEALSADN